MLLLVFGNIANYLYSNWNLVTVKVTDAPLDKVISSIEWQGWVKIYTNLPHDSKVTMYVDHVPLAEAMETLAANVDVPQPPPTADDSAAAPPTNGDQAGRPSDRPGGFAGAPPDSAPGAGGGGRGGGRGGGFGGGLGGRAQWNLAFFVAPNTAEAKEEIREFEAGDQNDATKIYTYGTQMQTITTENMSVTADPRLQTWPGMKPVNASTTAPADAQTNAMTQTPAGNGVAADSSAPTPPTVQTYLQALAQSANIWIMAPGSWTPAVSSAPPADSSIIRALKNLVSGSHGTVIQAIVLRTGGGGGGGRGNRGDVAGGDDAWSDRMLNAINGLPADERADAVEQLHTEIQFRKNLQSLPPEQRRQAFMQHMVERMLYADRSRLSPEKRAKMYQRMITMRTAAKANK